MSPWTFTCPECDAENVSADDHALLCAECGYEWVGDADDHGPGCDGPYNCVCGEVG